jgi:hypothetical protein
VIDAPVWLVYTVNGPSFPRVALYLMCIFCNAPCMVIIVLVLAGWVVASVVVAVLASTVFRGAQIRPETVKLPPELIDLTSPDLRSLSWSPEQSGADPLTNA